jgi:hypothetical protein
MPETYNEVRIIDDGLVFGADASRRCSMKLSNSSSNSVLGIRISKGSRKKTPSREALRRSMRQLESLMMIRM